MNFHIDTIDGPSACPSTEEQSIFLAPSLPCTQLR